MKKFIFLLALTMLGAAVSLAQRQTKTFRIQNGYLTDGKNSGEIKSKNSTTRVCTIGDFEVTFTGSALSSTTSYIVDNNKNLTLSIRATQNLYDFRSLTVSGSTQKTEDYSSSSNRVWSCSISGLNSITYFSLTFDRMLSDGDGTQDNPYKLKTADDWMAFADIVNGSMPRQDNTWACAKLANDIDLSSLSNAGKYMVGGSVTDSNGQSSNRYYFGTFDGDGHKITVNYGVKTGGGEQYVALFRRVGHATIKNLRVSGTYTVSEKFAAGIVGIVSGSGNTVTLSKCESDVKITTSVDGDATSAGLVAVVNDKARITLTDCAFYGSITGKSATNCGGLIGFVEKYDDYNSAGFLNNCLYAGTFDLKDTSGSATLARSRDGSWLTITNCYYLNALGNKQGDAITDDDKRSGHAAYLLQKSRTDASYWTQKLGSTETPKLDRSWLSKTGVLYYDTDKKSWYCDGFTFKDGTCQPIQFNYKVGTAAYSRGFSKTKGDLFTVCLPYDVQVKSDKGYSAYKLESFKNNYIIFTEINAGDTLKAYYPYLIQMTGTGGVKSDAFTGSDVIISPPSSINCSWSVSTSTSNCSFTASYEGMNHSSALLQSAYILQSDKLWHPVSIQDTTAYIPPYRGYLTISLTSGSAKALPMLLGVDDQATGIEAIKLDGNDGSARYYNLRGQYIGTSLDNVPAGIYINNKGKKIKK